MKKLEFVWNKRSTTVKTRLDVCLPAVDRSIGGWNSGLAVSASATETPAPRPTAQALIVSGNSHAASGTRRRHLVALYLRPPPEQAVRSI